MKPLSPRGKPTLPAIEYVSPSPSYVEPYLTSKDPPSDESFKSNPITPAIASEPY